MMSGGGGIKEKMRSKKHEVEEMKEEEEKMMRRLRSRALFADRQESWESCTSAGNCWEPVGSGEDEEVGWGGEEEEEKI